MKSPNETSKQPKTFNDVMGQRTSKTRGKL